MLKVCFIVADITWTGGIERVLSSLATCIPDETTKLEIVSLYRTYNNTYYDFPDNVTIKYINDNVEYEGRPGSLSRLIKHLKSVLKLKKHLDSAGYDIVVAHSFPSAFLNFFSKKKNKWAVVEHVSFSYYSPLLRSIRRFIYKKYDAIVLLTDKEVSKFESEDAKVFVIPNPVSFTSVKCAPLDHKRIISVGRLEKQKGYDLLLEAFAIISKKYPEWELAIYGQGTEEKQLKNIIDRFNLTNVKLMGLSQNIQQEYYNSSFYVMSSRYEGFGMVLLEAMTCGLPCVSFNCETGPADIIDDGINGYLIDNFDVNLLSQAMEKLILDEHLRLQMGQKAFNSVNKFSLVNINCKWKELFQELMSEK
ncbi:TPA: glycosyltransferase family 4 protein [Citrobacter werkmanii]